MSTKQAEDLVMQFLRTMEARNLEAAEAMTAPDVTIIFPGGKTFASQREMVAASTGRYRWVKKTFDHIDSFQKGAMSVVYVRGTLYGVNRHGVEFSGIRYVDRFVLRGGLIVSQEVWNDLAEAGALEQKS